MQLLLKLCFECWRWCITSAVVCLKAKAHYKAEQSPLMFSTAMTAAGCAALWHLTSPCQYWHHQPWRTFFFGFVLFCSLQAASSSCLTFLYSARTVPVSSVCTMDIDGEKHIKISTTHNHITAQRSRWPKKYITVALEMDWSCSGYYVFLIWQPL